MHNSRNSPLSDQIERFVIGWANSRRRGSVTLIRREEGLLCSFKQPIGSTKRQHELFVWETRAYQPTQLKRAFAGTTYFISLFDADESEKDRLLSLGYKPIANEQFMCLDVNLLPSVTEQPDPDIVLADNPQNADWFNHQRQENIIRLDQFKNDNIQVYFIKRDDRLVSWAREIQVNRSLIIDDVQTITDYQRQGLARRVMKQILHNAKRRGIDQILLAASESGHHLYTHLGFESIGDISVYSNR